PASRLALSGHPALEDIPSFAQNLDQSLDPATLLDEGWLAQEIDVLGDTMLFELLHLFRSSAATIFRKMSDTVERQDWQATANLLHALQGSAANLGMKYVVQYARTLQKDI